MCPGMIVIVVVVFSSGMELKFVCIYIGYFVFINTPARFNSHNHR